MKVGSRGVPGQPTMTREFVGRPDVGLEPGEGPSSNSDPAKVTVAAGST